MTGEGKDRPGVVASPPLIYLGLVVVGVLVDVVWPSAVLPSGAPYGIGLAIGAVGVAGLAVGRCAYFTPAGTSVPTRRSTIALVVRGPYRWSRNPIYICLSLIQLGIGIAAGNLWIVVLR